MGNPSLLMAMQNNTTTVEDSLAISYKTEHTLNISFSRLSNCNSLTKGVEKSSSSSSSYLHPESYTKIYTQMFLSALFIVAKTWKQLGSFSVGERINKLWQYMEKEMTTHSSTLAWKIPWTVEPGGL